MSVIDHSLFRSTPTLIAGTDVDALAVDLSAYIDNILRPPVEQHSLSEIRGASQSFAKTLEFHMVNDLSFDKMLKRASVRTPCYLLLFGSRGRPLVPYPQDRAPEALRAIATVPIFVHYKLSQHIASGPLFKAKFWAGGQRMWLSVFSEARAQATLSHRGLYKLIDPCSGSWWRTYPIE